MSQLKVLTIERPVRSIFATTDFHSHLENAAAMKGEADRRRLYSLVVDSGDFFEGTHYYRLGRGRIEAQILRDSYDIFVPGNHGWANYQSNGLDAKTLLSNVRPADRQSPFAIVARVNIAGSDFSVFGILGRQAFLAIPPDERDGWIWTEPAVAIRAIRDRFPLNRALILSHSGVEVDSKNVETIDCDIIFAGHCHSDLPAPLRLSDTWIAKAAEHGVGFVRADFDGSSWEVEHCQLSPPEGSTRKDLDSDVSALSSLGDHVLGSPHSRWRGGEIDRRQLTAAVAGYLAAKHGRGVLLNETALRTTRIEGQVLARHVFDIEPFANWVVEIEVPRDLADTLSLLSSDGLIPVTFGRLTPGDRFLTTGYVAAAYFADMESVPLMTLAAAVENVLTGVA